MSLAAEDYAAPAGQVWVCMACGKRAKDRVNGDISYGWDASCFLNAQLCDEAELTIEGGRVTKVGP